MADYLVTDTELTNIANTIRTKSKTSATLQFPDEFISAIEAISTGDSDKINLYQFTFPGFDEFFLKASTETFTELGITPDDLIPTNNKYVFTWINYSGSFSVNYADTFDGESWTKQFDTMDFCSYDISKPDILTLKGIAFLNKISSPAMVALNFVQGDGISGADTDRLYAVPNSPGFVNSNNLDEVKMYYIQTTSLMSYTLNILVIEK